MAHTGPRPVEPRQPASPPLQPPAAPSRGWTIALGVLMVVAGVLAIIFPLVTSLTVTIFVGWLLIVLGVLKLVHVFTARTWRNSLWAALVGVLFLIGGGLIVLDPLAGTFTLTAMLAAVFIVEGVIEVVGAFSRQGRSGRGWLLASGIVALIAGAAIALQLPGSALWVIGFLAGINFIFSGIGYLADTEGESAPAAPRPAA